MSIDGKREFYKEYIQVHEKVISRYIAAATNGFITDRDIMQRIMERAYDDIAQSDVTNDYLNQLYIIASKEIINAAKREHEDFELEHGVIPSKMTTARDIFMWIEREIEMAIYDRKQGIEHFDIFKQLEQMEFCHRTLIVMRYIAGLDKQDMAEILNISYEELENTLFYSLNMLLYHCGAFPADIVYMVEEWPGYDESYEKDIKSEVDKLLPGEEFAQHIRSFMYRIRIFMTEETPRCNLPAVDFSFLERNTQIPEDETREFSNMSFKKQVRKDIIKYDRTSTGVDDKSEAELECVLNENKKAENSEVK